MNNSVPRYSTTQTKWKNSKTTETHQEERNGLNSPISINIKEMEFVEKIFQQIKLKAKFTIKFNQTSILYMYVFIYLDITQCFQKIEENRIYPT